MYVYVNMSIILHTHNIHQGAQLNKKIVEIVNT